MLALCKRFIGKFVSAAVVAVVVAVAAAAYADVEGAILEVAAGVTLPSAITVKIQNPGPEVRKYDLIQFLGGEPETLPTFTVVGEGSDGWIVAARGGRLFAYRPSGMSVILR